MPYCARCERQHMPLTPKGEHNILIGFIGEPKTGKTCLACRVALEQFGDRTYRLGLDPNAEFPDRLPVDHKPTELHSHTSVERLEAALSEDSRGFHSLEQSTDLLAMVALARKLAWVSMLMHSDGRVRRGTPGVPVTLVADELHTCKAASRGSIDDELLILLASRRPLHVGFLWTTTAPLNVNHHIVDATPVFYFGRMVDPMQRAELRRRGVPDSVCNRIAQLPPHEFIRWERGEPTETPTGRPRKYT